MVKSAFCVLFCFLFFVFFFSIWLVLYERLCFVFVLIMSPWVWRHLREKKVVRFVAIRTKLNILISCINFLFRFILLQMNISPSGQESDCSLAKKTFWTLERLLEYYFVVRPSKIERILCLPMILEML